MDNGAFYIAKLSAILSVGVVFFLIVLNRRRQKEELDYALNLTSYFSFSPFA